MLREIGEKLKQGNISSTEYLNEKLARIESLDPKVQAFVELEKEEALKQAKESDERRAKGQELSPFDGIPIGIKDNIVTSGRKTSCASKILEGYTSPFSSTVIEKLSSQGFVSVGRLNMDEFAMGSSTENSAYQITRNPHDLERAPGGSSGGSAAAVAAGYFPAAFGSDTGGSIRQPAAFTGTVGLKPTYGTVSRYGLVAFASSLDQIGPISLGVEDAKILYDTIKGHDQRDSTTVPASLYRDVEAAPDKLKLGVPRSLIEKASPSILKSLDAILDMLKKDHSVEVIDIELPYQKYAIPVYYITATSEASANLARFDGIRYGYRADTESLTELYEKSRTHGFGSEVKRRILLGTYALSSGFYDAFYGKAQKVRTLIQREYISAFEKVHAILMPSTPTESFPIGEKTSDPVEMYLSDVLTVGASLAGIPALSVPGPTEGLPIGIQLQGPYFSENRLFEIAKKIEKAFPWTAAEI